MHSAVKKALVVVFGDFFGKKNRGSNVTVRINRISAYTCSYYAYVRVHNISIAFNKSVKLHRILKTYTGTLVSHAKTHILAPTTEYKLM